MKDRVAGKSPRESVVPASLAGRMASPVMESIILGVDPSLRGTGYGVIRTGRPDFVVLAQGTISCPRDWERSRCLAHITRTLRTVLHQYRPEVCAVEGLFFAQNLKTAIIMGEARGAAMAVIAEAGLDIFEIATRKVKQAVVGYGAAQKIAVARMVQRMLKLAELPAPDAADALALALAHAQENSRYRLNLRKKI
ncbi:MAG: crossover junction endodeoxyribonuclease RuvC [Verrucomicrobiota bacterium]|jgi:crossover junction endodeoxyribonuclease RuvC